MEDRTEAERSPSRTGLRSCVPHNNNINDVIPEEIMLYMFSFLSINELCLSARVCKTWNRIAQDSELWKPYVTRDWDSANPDKPRRSRRPSSWKGTYAKKYKGKHPPISIKCAILTTASIAATQKKPPAVFSKYIEQEGSLSGQTWFFLALPLLLGLAVMIFVHLPSSLSSAQPKKTSNGKNAEWSGYGDNFHCGSGSGNFLADLLICLALAVLIYVVAPIVLR